MLVSLYSYNDKEVVFDLYLNKWGESEINAVQFSGGDFIKMKDLSVHTINRIERWAMSANIDQKAQEIAFDLANDYND